MGKAAFRHNLFIVKLKHLCYNDKNPQGICGNAGDESDAGCPLMKQKENLLSEKLRGSGKELKYG